MIAWRTGTKNPHAIYKDDQPAGFVADAVDAIELCAAMNGIAALRARAEAAEQWRDNFQNARDAYGAEVAKLRAQLADKALVLERYAELRGENERLEEALGRSGSEAAALRSELTELESERDQWTGLYQRTIDELAGQPKEEA